MAPLLRDLLAISRAYSIAYLSLLGLCAQLTAPAPLLPSAIAGALLLPGAFTIGMAALNDAVHARRDALAGRGRAYAPGLLLATGAVGVIIALLLAALTGGWPVFAGIAASVGLGLLYAIVKRAPLLSNLVRGATTVPLVLAVAAMQPGSTPLWLALGAGLLDASGNIWGDVRDVEVDRRGGVTTIALLQPATARLSAAGLHLAALAALTPLTPAVWATAPITLAAWRAKPRASHLVFLVGKYLTFVLVGLLLAGTASEYILIILSGALSVPSAVLYRRVHHI